MLSCLCCGPLPLEGGIPGHINFQEERARRKSGYVPPPPGPDITLPEQVTWSEIERRPHPSTLNVF